jgi:predicted NAD/FAD-dependent oxidoreductase
MTALAKHLAESLKVELATTVSRVERKPDQLWHLSTIDKTVAGPFDRLVVSIPAAQAKTLLCDCGPVLGRIEPAEMQPCWAVLAGFDRHIDVPYDGALVEHSPLAWIARNNSKPGRGGAEAWVLHASANWSIQNLENSADMVAEGLLAEFQRLTSDNTRPSYVHAHRWRYAKASKPLNADAVWSPELGISVSGDWCAGSRVEDAYLSGIAAATHVLTA